MLEKEFDQFYTKNEVAKNCFLNLSEILKQFSISLSDAYFLEPSAGEGAFLNLLPTKKFFACDIDPKKGDIKKFDFLKDDISNFLPKKEKVIVIGNPPFGKRAKLAIDFINTSFFYSDIVAFILPLQFNKFSAQSQIISDANLIYNKTLDPKSFIFKGKECEVRCCFQIWTRNKNYGEDLRIQEAPKTHHKDFEMWQYNNTREAEKYFNKDLYEWDFAVPRQGYKNYEIKETDPKKMDRKTQWIFFRANSKKILKNLTSIDFTKLSKKNTSIPGFGKADVIYEYEKLFYSIDVISTSIQTFQLGDPNPNLAKTLTLFDNL